VQVEVSSIFGFGVTQPQSWPWPRALTVSEMRDNEARWDPPVHILSGYRTRDAVHYIMRTPKSHGGDQWRAVLSDDGHVRLTPHGA
jgi:hypothetical protein